MEVFSKGIHRALVPLDSQMENISGVELMETASGYRMLTQMDLLNFFKAHEQELQGLLLRPVKEFGAVTDIIFGVTDKTTVIHAIRGMNRASLTALPIVESTEHDSVQDQCQIVNGKGRKLVGTFSATGLRGCPISVLRSCLQMKVLDFISKLTEIPLQVVGLRNSTKELIACRPESLLGEVVDKSVDNHVHRVWVVDELGLLAGVVSLTDIIRATRVWMLSEEA